MKKHESSQTLSGNFDQSTYYLPINFFASVPGTKDVKTQKENLQNPRNNNQTAVQTNSSFCSNAIESENKRGNELGILSLAINYCLNTQSRIADTLAEIGQYLKDFGDDSSNVHVSAQTSRKQKQALLSPSASTIFASNRSLNKQTENLSKKFSINSILTKIEVLQKDINLKIRDFDSRIRTNGLRNGNNLTCIISPLDDYSFSANSRLSPQQRMTDLSTGKQSEEAAKKKQISIQPASSQGQLNNKPYDLLQKRRETLPDETLNSSKNNLDAQSTENSRIINLNLSTLNLEMAKQSKITDKKAVPQRKNVASKLQLNLYDIKNTKDSTNNPASSPSNVGDNTSKNENTKAIKLDLQPGTKNLQETVTKQIIQKNAKEKTFKKDFSRQQTKTKKITNTRESESLDRKGKPLEKKNILSTRRGTTDNNTTALLNLSKSAGFLSLKSSRREANFDFDMRKNSTKPDLSIVPQKEIIDDGAPDNTADHSMQKDNSIISVGENGNELDRSLNLDTERVYGMNEMDDLMQNPTQSFLKNTSRKEKMIIKTLMRDQYGEETSSYQKADHGHVYQKKCLINARWWRSWKDFVNFDSEEDYGNRTSMFEIGLYPRPGPINNRELIREDVLLDLGNLTPDLELKENLLEHHDYEAVSKKVYDVLAKWYGFDFEICRVLRPDPFRDNKPYLELYPKKKTAGKLNQTSVDTKKSNSSTKVINSIINSNLSHNIA